MLILALTTSTKLASISIFENDTMLGNVNMNMHKTHSTTIVEQITDLFEWSEKSIDDVDVILLSKGPGSFTGVRIAMSLIKGMYSLSNKVKLYTVSELDAIYYLAKNYADIVVAGIDSRKGKIYYNIHSNGTKIVEDSIGNIYDLIQEMEKYDKSIVYAGDIALNYTKDIKHNKLVEIDPNRLLIDSRVYFEMYKKNLLKEEKIAEVVPYYLEKSQAEKDFN
ncbi:tRNA (adenosine(37)-N6)-threonylcarbamoyltransferase complex dimerization subunit type 1 TsaB [Caviibacter abscessus]|uniref:tRNA (adenosine(37)-N6)-threonylcarbamoyltransferase complex dimerization subunit type 1 TsaB n=1 Tax=Caviibacter abscessus TaxID=1766719 RepID=UPI000832B5B5|nr:tRNA (adenosine(37)-N6)-threonylcarbamoyltransferase complex dimerization subunit type 1 TsaB [Caviibacter abscessus]